MSRWGLFPLGCTGLLPFPSPDLSACLSHLALSLTLRLSVHPFVCHPPSISSQSTSLKQPPAFWYLVIRPSYYSYLSIHPVRCLRAEIWPGSHHPRRFALRVTSERLMEGTAVQPHPLPHPVIWTLAVCLVYPLSFLFLFLCHPVFHSLIRLQFNRLSAWRPAVLLWTWQYDVFYCVYLYVCRSSPSFPYVFSVRRSICHLHVSFSWEIVEAVTVAQNCSAQWWTFIFFFPFFLKSNILSWTDGHQRCSKMFLLFTWNTNLKRQRNKSFCFLGTFEIYFPSEQTHLT